MFCVKYLFHLKLCQLIALNGLDTIISVIYIKLATMHCKCAKYKCKKYNRIRAFTNTYLTVFKNVILSTTICVILNWQIIYYYYFKTLNNSFYMCAIWRTGSTISLISYWHQNVVICIKTISLNNFYFEDIFHIYPHFSTVKIVNSLYKLLNETRKI